MDYEPVKEVMRQFYKAASEFIKTSGIQDILLMKHWS